MQMAKPVFAFYFFGILSFGLSNPKLLATSAAQKALSVDDLGQKQKHAYLSYTQVRISVLRFLDEYWHKSCIDTHMRFMV